MAHVHVQGWHEAYTGRIPQQILDGLDVQERASMWRGILAGEFPDHESTIAVAEAEGRIVGFASSGRSIDEDAVAGRRQLYSIYLLADYYGSGAGQRLLDAVIGTAAASLWVLDDNPRAWAFYTRNGFVPDGVTKIDDRWGAPITDARLVRGPRA